MMDSSEHHRQRSEFIRRLVQRSVAQQSASGRYARDTPHNIVQYWHNLRELPQDVNDCISSWTRWTAKGFTHRLFDEHAAKAFISGAFDVRHVRAFERCYHPAMQADYFRLCYLMVEGGFYVDADDVCVGSDIEFLFDDGRLKIQPLCYDVASTTMVDASTFLQSDAFDPSWIFYFNNDPLIAAPAHPIIERALLNSTNVLNHLGEDMLPEIQETTGPGNLTKCIFDRGTEPGGVEQDLVVLGDWDSIAVSKWPLSYRNDARNWRISNQRRYSRKGD